MGTLTEEIFSRRLERDVHAGEIVVAPVDYAMAHDVTGPLAIEAFRHLEVRLWDPERVILVFDHILPANTVASAGLHKLVRDFATEYGVTHVFQEGICHQLMVEKGFIRPGGIVVGADSHSTTYGALGCFAAGCCWGVPTHVPWAVTFTNRVANELVGVPLDVPLHPTQLYEAFAEAAIFAVLMWRFRKPHQPGALIGLYLILYGTARFLVEFVRNHEQGNLWGGPLDTSQYISLVLVALAAVWQMKARKRQPIAAPVTN